MKTNNKMKMEKKYFILGENKIEVKTENFVALKIVKRLIDQFKTGSWSGNLFVGALGENSSHSYNVIIEDIRWPKHKIDIKYDRVEVEMHHDIEIFDRFVIFYNEKYQDYDHRGDPIKGIELTSKNLVDFCMYKILQLEQKKAD